jgi:protein TonB
MIDMSSSGTNRDLKAYEIYISSSSASGRWTYGIVLVFCLGLFMAAGAYFRTVKPEMFDISEKISMLRTQFVVPEEKKKIKVKKPDKPEKKVEVKEKPVDLTEKPLLRQKEEDVRKLENKPQAQRKVYGLRKVYSRGIGSGGSLSDAVIGKIGNTINKDVDDIVAVKEDVKGVVVSATTVTTAPRFIKRIKPEYTQEMIDNKIEGVINLKVLIDIDGRVKKAIAMNDLGFGSAQRAIDACYQMEFEPARRGDDAVAVWIAIPIRFVLLG